MRGTELDWAYTPKRVRPRQDISKRRGQNLARNLGHAVGKLDEINPVIQARARTLQSPRAASQYGSDSCLLSPCRFALAVGGDDVPDKKQRHKLHQLTHAHARDRA